MRDQLTDEQNEAILKILNETIDSGPWDKSSFLGVIGKNLNQIRDAFLTEIGTPTQAQQRAESGLASKAARQAGLKEIYISLYSSTGNDIFSWERIIASLPRQVISRPVYSEEQDVKNAIRSKENTLNEAYVAILINPDDILELPADKIAKDRHGKTLLSLKDRSINIDNINRFIHQNTTYKYEKGHLKKTN